MKLTPQQATIIGHCCFQADASIPDIAKSTGFKQHTVRRVIDNLKQREVLLPRLYVNPFAKGVTEYQVFLTLLNSNEKEHVRIVETLKNSDGVSYVGRVGGSYHLDVLLCVRSLDEVSAFFETLSATLKDIDFEKIVAAEVALTYYAPKYLGLKPKDLPIQQLSCAKVPKIHQLDELDHKLMYALMHGAGWTSVDLSRRVGIPPSTVRYRLAQLKDKGVILALGYQVNAFQVNATPYILLVEMKKSPPGFRRRLNEYCCRHPNITYLMENLGAWDYQIGVRVLNQLELPRVAQEIQDAFGAEMKRVTPIPVYDMIKLDSYPFRSYERVSGAPRPSFSRAGNDS